jgi:hypothetical protein
MEVYYKSMEFIKTFNIFKQLRVTISMDNSAEKNNTNTVKILFLLTIYDHLFGTFI